MILSFDLSFPLLLIILLHDIHLYFFIKCNLYSFKDNLKKWIFDSYLLIYWCKLYIVKLHSGILNIQNNSYINYKNINHLQLINQKELRTKDSNKIIC